jgi:hypothetical protein
MHVCVQQCQRRMRLPVYPTPLAGDVALQWRA